MSELLYRLALTLVPQVGDVHARLLLSRFGSAEAVFKAKKADLERLEGIGTVRAESILAFRGFEQAEKEMAFIGSEGITPLFLSDATYPQRLLHCTDAPALLFYRGTADLNAARILGVVGTRRPTDYGRQQTEKLIAGWAEKGVLIVSGLAFGIDALAHKSAIRHGLPTVGVVAHGHDRVYPPDHAGLAEEMLRKGGGLLTECFSGTEPEKHHFPLRNRIVAGLCDAVVVIETEVKGGSMITARLADSYNRDVFALPGRSIDRKSSGCNRLIQHHRAIMLTHPDELLTVMGWDETSRHPKPTQRELFVALTPEEKCLYDLLQEREGVALDELHARSGLATSALAAALLHLELQGIITALPGKMYRLN